METWETMNFQFMHVDGSPYDYTVACIQFLVASLNANGCKALHQIIKPMTMNTGADGPVRFARFNHRLLCLYD